MTHIPEQLRRVVRNRAQGKCEYCLLHERYTMTPYEIDHIFSEKHGGLTTADNLCLSCLNCNRYKGSDICSFDIETGELVALFHPHREQWSDHFGLEEVVIQPITATGRVTVRLLRMNDLEQIDERRRLLRLRRYPG